MININMVFLFQAVNFLVLLALLNVLLYKPVRKALAGREADIEDSREKTAAVDRDVRDKMEQYEQRLREVKAAAHEERNNLVREARSEESSILDSARGEAADSLSAIRTSIMKEVSEAESRLRIEAEALSRSISEKILGRSLS
jgi:F-type H+-transporting ATPase subunit b